MNENGGQSLETTQRLCNEIQLFDLCERESCNYRVGRFCTNPDLLARFERISDDERRPVVPSFATEEMDEDMVGEMDEEFDDELGIDDLDDERDIWENE